MAVSLPTAADVRKAREQATQVFNERFEAVRTPLLAWLGANDLAASRVTEAVAKARTRAAERRGKLTSDELRKQADALSKQAMQTYEELAKRGETTLARLREQPQVARALKNLEGVSGQVGTRVEVLVDEMHDVAENVLGRVSTGTRSAGEKTARATKNVAGEAADAVADAGAEAASAVREAGEDAAHTTRSATRKAANRTQPAKPAAARRTSNGAQQTDS